MDKDKGSEEKDEFCPTRQTLLLKVKNQQDEKSWEDFVHYYSNFIYMICQKMSLSHHDSEETVQKVLLKLWNKLPDFDYSTTGRFRGWLCAVTGNTVKDLYRSQKRQSAKNEAAKDEILWNMEKASLPEIELQTKIEWERHISNLALESVGKCFTEKVVAIFTQFNKGVSAEELSEKYELPSNTIYKHCQRVKAKLHAELRRLHFELN
jgi:RNA polymerase sigma factor (sigma-70 family)